MTTWIKENGYIHSPGSPYHKRILRAVDHANERAQQVVSIEMLMDGGWEIILTAPNIIDAQVQLETVIR